LGTWTGSAGLCHRKSARSWSKSGSSWVAAFKRSVCNVGDADCGCSAPGSLGLKEIAVAGVCAEVDAGEHGLGGKVNDGLTVGNGVGGSLLGAGLVFERADDSGIGYGRDVSSFGDFNGEW
jgi:hypothetical protein